MCGRKIVVFLLASFCLLLMLYLARGQVLPAAAAWLDVGEAPRPADAIMLLNGDENARPFAAAALLQGRWSSRVLIGKVDLSPQMVDGVALPTHEVNRRVLRHYGVPEEDVVLLDANDAQSTYDEAQGLAAYLDSSPDLAQAGPRPSILIVTTAPHTRRAKWIFQRILGDRVQRISMISATTDSYATENWWANDVGLFSVGGEYLKLAIYLLLYGWLGYALIGGACLWIAWQVYRRLRGASSPEADGAARRTSARRSGRR